MLAKYPRLFTLPQLFALVALFIVGLVALYVQNTYVVDMAERAAQATQSRRLANQMGLHFELAQREWKNVQQHRTDPRVMLDDMSALQLHQREQHRIGNRLESLLSDEQTRETLKRFIAAAAVVDGVYSKGFDELLFTTQKNPSLKVAFDASTVDASQQLSILQSAVSSLAEQASVSMYDTARVIRLVSIWEMLVVMAIVTGCLAWIAHKLDRSLRALAEQLLATGGPSDVLPPNSTHIPAKHVQQMPSPMDQLVQTVVELEGHAQMLAASIRESQAPQSGPMQVQVPVALAAEQVIRRAMRRKP